MRKTLTGYFWNWDWIWILRNWIRNWNLFWIVELELELKIMDLELELNRKTGNDPNPGWRQAIIWTNAGIFLIGPLGTKFSEILIESHTFSFKKMHFKMLSGKWLQMPWPPSQYKYCLSRYGDFHHNDETITRPCYLYNLNPYTGKRASLYWDGTLAPCVTYQDISSHGGTADSVMKYFNLNHFRRYANIFFLK